MALTLTASDNDITIQTSIDCVNEDDFKIENEGSIIIQGKYILDIVRKLLGLLDDIDDVQNVYHNVENI